MIIGTIKSYSANEGVTILIDGEDTPTEKDYKFLASYIPAVDDRVLIEEISGTYVVLGKISDNTADFPKVETASNADYATNAGNADYATRAGSANSANTAKSATNATKATEADKATNADKSTMADGVVNQTSPNNANARVRFKNNGSSVLQYSFDGYSWYTVAKV